MDERVEKAIDAGVKAGEHAAYKERCTLGHSIELACRAAIEAYRKAEPAHEQPRAWRRSDLADELSQAYIDTGPAEDWSCVADRALELLAPVAAPEQVSALRAQHAEQVRQRADDAVAEAAVSVGIAAAGSSWARGDEPRDAARSAVEYYRRNCKAGKMELEAPQHEPDTEDTKPRDHGCKCHQEEGDSPCPVHGEDEEAAKTEAPKLLAPATAHEQSRAWTTELAEIFAIEWTGGAPRPWGAFVSEVRRVGERVFGSIAPEQRAEKAEAEAAKLRDELARARFVLQRAEQQAAELPAVLPVGARTFNRHFGGRGTVVDWPSTLPENGYKRAVLWDHGERDDVRIVDIESLGILADEPASGAPDSLEAGTCGARAHWENASPADALRPNDRHAQVLAGDLAGEAHRIDELERSMEALKESLETRVQSRCGYRSAREAGQEVMNTPEATITIPAHLDPPTGFKLLDDFRALVRRGIEEQLKRDSYHKRYEGAVGYQVNLPPVVDWSGMPDPLMREHDGKQEHTVHLYCYVLGPSRQYEWKAETAEDAFAQATRDFTAWMYEAERDE